MKLERLSLNHALVLMIDEKADVNIYSHNQRDTIVFTYQNKVYIKRDKYYHRTHTKEFLKELRK